MQQEQAGTSPTLEVDLTQWPNAQKLLQRCQDFFVEVENLYISKHVYPFGPH
jgi:hypothetical protein